MMSAAILGSARGEPMEWKRNRLLGFAPALIFVTSLHSLGQTSGSNASPPLGDIVKKSKQTVAPKSKVVVNDDNLNSQRGPIPGIAFEGVDNSDEIIRATANSRNPIHRRKRKKLCGCGTTSVIQ